MPQAPTVGSFQLMKSLNRSLVLNTIREEGPISRADVAKTTKLTPPTVSNIVKELIESGIIIEKNQGVSRGGRKPTMLVINARNFYVIGLDVGPKDIKVILTDLNANIVEQFQKNIPKDISSEGLLALMKESIRPLLETSHVDQHKFLGIGVGMHGMVDVEKGVSLFAPNLQLRDIPIKESLEEEFKMIVKVENDARAMALGEAWFGNGNGAESAVCVNVGRGIGAGIIINGKLFHGEHFIGGEIGHMTIDIDGPKCSCGNYGCLQALAAGPVITDRAAKEIATGRESLLEQLAEGDLQSITGEMVHRAAEKGDPLSVEILDEIGRYLGIGLTNLIHTVNPDRIVIGGGVAKSGDYILDSIKKTIAQRALTDKAKRTGVHLSKLGEHATAIGAISLLLVELFSTRTAE
ncbi:MAG TPA: ROK family transcriptional regulator [Bacillales bacterium]|nr:ROK family transcriptional regulator [Bacillales bacterium]